MEAGFPKEAPDFGQGGMALALSDLTGDGFDEVVFAPMYSPLPHQGQTVRAHIHVLTSNSAGDELVELPGTQGMPVAGTVAPDDFFGYGASGLAIFDLPTSPFTKVIAVTTMNGELAVFNQTNGILDGTPLFRRIVEGSVGAFGSIVLADLDPASSRPELYLAGSSGIRRFDFQP